MLNKKLRVRLLSDRGKDTLSRIFSNWQAVVGIVIIGIFIFFAIFGKLLFPYSSTTDFANRFQPCSFEHWLGTDEMGRDVFRQLVNGAQSGVAIAILTALMTSFLGVFFGMLSGYLGGIPDKILQVITNLFLNIPTFPILLLLSTLVTIEDPLSFAIVLSVFNWAGLSRAVRAQVISLKERDFIEICRVMKMSRMHIIFKELMPNISSYLIINFILQMKGAILGSVGIMTLGLAGFDPTNWGAMLYRARTAGLVNKSVMSFLLKPLITVCLFQIGATMLANGLDEVLNPRLQNN